MIEVKNLNLSFGEEGRRNQVLFDVSLQVKQGEIFGLVGESGSGKTTVLKCLAGLFNHWQGELTIDGQPLAHRIDRARCRQVQMVFQDPYGSLHPRHTLGDILEEPLQIQGIGQRQQRVVAMLDKVGLNRAWQTRYPHQLSGGQRQRVALARSLAKRPKLLLLDEPMGALDKKLRDRMQLEVVDILERVGATCVMVTHDQEEAMTMAGRIAIMNRGKFVQIGEPEEIYEHPTSRYSAEFIGSVNVFEGLLRERQADGLVIDSPGLMHPLKVDSDVSVVDNVPVHVALRPEKVMLCDEVPADGCNFAVGEVVHIAYLGDLSIFHVRLHSGQMISAQLQNAHRYRKGLPTWGDEVRLCWESDSCVVLTV